MNLKIHSQNICKNNKCGSNKTALLYKGGKMNKIFVKIIAGCASAILLGIADLMLPIALLFEICNVVYSRFLKALTLETQIPSIKKEKNKCKSDQ